MFITSKVGDGVPYINRQTVYFLNEYNFRDLKYSETLNEYVKLVSDGLDLR